MTFYYCAARGNVRDGCFLQKRAACGQLTTVAKQFRAACRDAGLSDTLVLYSARHTFGTAAYEATSNLAVVMKVMGHTDVRTSMRYQHPTLDSLRVLLSVYSRYGLHARRVAMRPSTPKAPTALSHLLPICQSRN